MAWIQTSVAVLVMYTVCCSAAQLWTASDADCLSATPLSIFGTPIDDLKSNVTITAPVAGVPDSGFCPKLPYTLNLNFNEKRIFILTTSQGVLTGTGATQCPNRLVQSQGKASFGVQLTLPCEATGTVSITVSSVQADKNSTKNYKQIVLRDLPIAPLSACAVSQCSTGAPTTAAAAASTSSAGNAAATTATTTSGTTSTTTSSSTTATVKPAIKLPTLADLLKKPTTTASAGGTTTKPVAAVTVPDLATLLKIPKLNLTLSGKPFTFPKIKLDLSIPKMPTNIVVDLKLPTVGSSSLASLPAMLESILEQLGQQLKKTAAELGIEVVEGDLAAGSSATATSTATTTSTTTRSVGQAVESTGDAINGITSNIEAWMKAAAAMAAGRRLLSDVDNEIDQGLAPEAYPGLEQLDMRLARTLLEVNSTVKTDVQKISSRVSLLSSDAFAISYTAFKVAKSALSLLIAYLKSSATGTISIDDIALLDFTANVAALGGELSDMLSRISKTNADAVAPMGLSFKFTDVINRLLNKTTTSP